MASKRGLHSKLLWPVICLGRAFLGITCLGMAAHAHHSVAALYDDAQPVSLQGVVTKFDWANPHVWVYLDLESRGGSLVPWEVEFASRLELKRQGWSADTLHSGDAVEIQAIRARDGSPRAYGQVIRTASGDVLRGEELPLDNVSRVADPSPAPRWPDGHPRLGPEPGSDGYWANPSKFALYEDSAPNREAPLRMNRDGLLADLADAARVAPFQDWALSLYRYRQQNRLVDDPMAACLPPGGPRQFHARYGLRLLDQPERRRVFVLSRGGNRNWRLIDLDGRPVPEPREETPTYFGYSSGAWQGDSLVIESTGYVERFWMSSGGLPHTEAMRLTERISRPSASTLNYEVTVDDPGAYTRPWTARWTLQWIPVALEGDRDEDEEYFCDDYNRELEHVN